MGANTEVEPQELAPDETHPNAGTAEATPDASTADAKPEAEAPVNRWEALREKIADLGEGKLDKPAPTAEESEGQDEEDEPEKSEGGEEEKPEEKPVTPTRYRIVDTDGNEFELEGWPEGAKVVFKADRQEVAVQSLDELVGLAQKGVHAQRRLSEWGEERSRLGGRVQTLEGEVRMAEELLLKALFDKDVHATLRKELRQYRDPETRDAFRAKGELEQKQSEEAEATEAQHEQAITEFWSSVGETIRGRIGNYEYLDADQDAEEIVTRFYGLAEQVFEREDAQLRQQHPGASDEAITAAAERVAMGVLTSANLLRTMQELNDRYASRLGANGRKPAEEEENPKEEVEAHNRRVDTKLEQRERTRTARGGGALPGGGGSGELPEGATFEERMEAMRATLRSAGRK